MSNDECAVCGLPSEDGFDHDGCEDPAWIGEMEPLIDLVVVAYRAPAETRRFLESLDQVDVPFTITLIENASPEPDVRTVLEEGWPRVESLSRCVEAKLIFNAENVGYARACNQGAKRGSAPVIALLNADTEWREGVGERILDTFSRESRAGVVGPKTTDRQGRLTHAGIIKRGASDTHRHWLAQDLGQADDVLDVPTVSGATYFVLREMWDELTACQVYRDFAPNAQGAFLPTRHYFEETFCSYHAQAHGWRVIYDGRAHMIHEWNRSIPDSRETKALFKESRDLYRRACLVHGITNHGAE